MNKKLFVLMPVMILLLSFMVFATREPYPCATTNPYDATNCWDFNDAGTTVTDRIGGLDFEENDGDAVIETSFLTGFGNMGTVDGNDNWETAVTGMLNATEFTISMWILLTTIGGDDDIFHHWSGSPLDSFHISHGYPTGGSGSVGGRITDTANHIGVAWESSAGFFVANSITHLTIVLNGSILVYRNGTLFGEVGCATDCDPADIVTELQLGGADNWLQGGSFDDFLIFDEIALNSTAIKCIYDGDCYITLDTTPPFFTQHSVNNSLPVPLDVLNISINITDDTLVNGYIFSAFNETLDKWVNLSYVELNGITNTTNVYVTVGEYVYFNYTFFANDSSNNWNNSEEYFLQVNNFPPFFNNQTINQTLIYYLSWVNMSINISDPNPKRSRFEWNATGTWVQDGVQTFENGETVSTLKRILLPHLNDVCWRYWAEDRGKNENTSDEMCFDVLNTFSINATVIHPVNTSNNTVLNFTFTSYDYDGDEVIFLIYLNGVLETNTTTNITDYDLADGNYNLTVGVYDGYGYSGNSSTTSFIMSTLVGEEDDEEEVLVMGECPAGSTAEVLLFAFIGFFLLSILVVCMTIIKIPFMTILIGLAFIMFSFLLYPCNALIAMVMSFFAVGLIIFEFSQSGKTSLMG